MKNIKEVIYTVLMFIVWQMIANCENYFQFFGLLWLSVILFSSWVLSNIMIYKDKKVSPYSNALLKINIKSRLFSSIITPFIMIFAVSIYVFLIPHLIFIQAVILTAILIIFVYMIGVKNNYKKFFYVGPQARILYALINFFLFFIVLSISIFFLQEDKLLRAGLLSFFVFFSYNIDLIQRNIYEKRGFLITLLFSAITFLFIYFLNNIYSSWLYIFVMSLVYFVHLSFWQIRLSGDKKLKSYFMPLIFALMLFLILVVYL